MPGFGSTVRLVTLDNKFRVILTLGMIPQTRFQQNGNTHQENLGTQAPALLFAYCSEVLRILQLITEPWNCIKKLISFLFFGDVFGTSSLAGPQECWLLTASRLQVVTAQVKMCLNPHCLALHSFMDIYTGRYEPFFPQKALEKLENTL